MIDKSVVTSMCTGNADVSISRQLKMEFASPFTYMQ